MQVERDVKDIVQSLVSQEGPYTVERYNVGTCDFPFVFYQNIHHFSRPPLQTLPYKSLGPSRSFHNV